MDSNFFNIFRKNRTVLVLIIKLKQIRAPSVIRYNYIYLQFFSNFSDKGLTDFIKSLYEFSALESINLTFVK